jgi:hypothetical protein
MYLGVNMTNVQIVTVNSWTFPDGITILKRQPPGFATVRNNIYLVAMSNIVMVIAVSYTDNAIDNTILDLPATWANAIMSSLMNNGAAASDQILSFPVGGTVTDKLVCRVQILPFDKIPYFPRLIAPDTGTGLSYDTGEFRTQTYPDNNYLASDIGQGLVVTGFALPFNDTKFVGYSRFTLFDVFDIDIDATSNSILFTAPHGIVIMTFTDSTNRDAYFAIVRTAVKAQATAGMVINLPNQSQFMINGITRISITSN